MSPMLVVVAVLATAVVVPPVVLLVAWLEWRAPEVLVALLGSAGREPGDTADRWAEVGARPRGTWTMAPAAALPARRSRASGDPVAVVPVARVTPVRLAAGRR